MKYAILETNH